MSAISNQVDLINLDTLQNNVCDLANMIAYYQKHPTPENYKRLKHWLGNVAAAGRYFIEDFESKEKAK